jgi:hypothetical protein
MGWVGGRVAFALLSAVPVLAGDVPLFPVSLHLVRRVEDPIANTATEVDEYCTGNKIITIRGAKTAIVDYDRQELIEIDRAASTYSVASFEDIAKAKSLGDPAAPKRKAIASTAARPVWTTTPLGVKSSSAGRSADSFELKTDHMTVDVAVDREITLSRAALDALSGGGYPNRASEQQDAVARACVRTTDTQAQMAGGGTYGLPLDQSITIDADANTKLTIRNTVIKVTNELPRPELLAIPAGAALVESRAARMVRTLKEAEQGSKSPSP